MGVKIADDWGDVAGGSQRLHGVHPWAAKALADELDAVASAVEGTRNDTLNRAAFNLGQLVPHLLDADNTEAALADAARACGLGDREAGKTIASGFAAGQAQPRQPEERPQRREVRGNLSPAPERIDPATGEVLDLAPARVATTTSTPAKVHRGQARMAYRLADAYADRLLHVHGIGWHAWDGRRWVEDKHGAATRAVLDVLRDALADSLGDADLRADVRKCESAAGVAGVLELASSLEVFAATVADLDADPYRLNTATGTLDLRTMELDPHDPRDRITKVTTAGYDPAASGPTWGRFLAEVLPDPDVLGFLQRYVGLGLCGAVLEHVLAILTGTGRNGKGVFYGALGAALGDYAITAEPDLFMHRTGGHPTGEMDLRGARWVVVSESDEGRRLAEATVKRLTGGDRIKARRMRQDFVEFTPSHTAALVTNHLPKVNGDDPALWARLRVVPFTVVIPKADQDPHLGERLAVEVDAILAWAVAGWTDYRAHRLAEPEAVMAATEAYQAESDAVRRFVADRCLTMPPMFTTTAEAFAAWTKWATTEDVKPLSQKAFGQALDRLGFPADPNRRRRRYGIGLAADDDEEGAS